MVYKINGVILQKYVQPNYKLVKTSVGSVLICLLGGGAYLYDEVELDSAYITEFNEGWVPVAEWGAHYSEEEIEDEITDYGLRIRVVQAWREVNACTLKPKPRENISLGRVELSQDQFGLWVVSGGCHYFRTTLPQAIECAKTGHHGPMFSLN